MDLDDKDGLIVADIGACKQFFSPTKTVMSRIFLVARHDSYTVGMCYLCTERDRSSREVVEYKKTKKKVLEIVLCSN